MFGRNESRIHILGQADLTGRVDKDTALAKAVYITKKQKKESNHSQEMTVFVVGALLPSTEAGRARTPLATTKQRGRKQTRGGFSHTPKGPRDPKAISTSQGSPKPSSSAEGKTPTEEV